MAVDAHGAELPTIVQVMQLAQAASGAQSEADPELALEKLEAAVALRPDLPAILHRLAVAQATVERFDEARETLLRLAEMGLGLSSSELDALSMVRSRPEFAEVLKQLSANLRSKGKGDQAFTLQGVTGLIEGIAWRESTGEFYFGDVNARAVWLRNKDSTLRRLTPEGDELLGVVGLAIDEAKGTLWAATSAVRAMEGFTSEQEGSAELVEIDLANGGIRQIIPVPKSGSRSASVLSDLALHPNGGLYATDRGEPVIWHLPSGGTTLERLVESAEFISLRGIALMGEALIVADRLNGILRVDLRDRSVDLLEPPEGVTLTGINGLVGAPDGSLLALQAGVNPTRVLRIELETDAASITAVTVLESGHLTMSAPSLGCVGPDGNVFFVGNSSWSRFEQTGGRPIAARPVPVFKTSVKAVGR